MGWLFLVFAILIALALVVAGLLVVIRVLHGREPYASFLELRLRQKVGFFKSFVTDPRIPWYVKAVPFLVVAYLAMPFDLIPDFIPVLGQLDDVGVVLAGLALMVRLVPRPIIDQLIAQSAGLPVPASDDDDE